MNMLQKKYKSTVVSVVNPFEGIYTVGFKAEKGKYKYQPGQFLHLALENDYDGAGQWPDSRCFSMQSNPNEEHIYITYAVKGKFTQHMEKVLHLGAEVWLKLPYGDLFQQTHNKEKTVFIAGGTGVTPFLSLFTHVSFKEYLKPRVYLGFKSKEYNIYEDELESLPEGSLTVVYQDADGIIDIDHIFNENGTSANYFISGPPAMITSFKMYLIEKGVAVGGILTDDWE